MTEVDDWTRKPMRWCQLTLTEPDVSAADVERWLAYFRDCRGDAACLSAGGYIAYYPTDVPGHYRSRWLQGSDPFRALAEGCREMGMVVLARTDAHAVHDDVRRSHPEWIRRGPDGSPQAHWSMPGAWLTCTLGLYNFEHMTAVHREIMERYDVQGIFTNRWSNMGICYCEHCSDTFAAASGYALPRPGDVSSDAYQAYLQWQEDVYLRLVDTWRAAVSAARPGARMVPNSGPPRPLQPGTVDLARLIGKVDMLFSDHQGRHGNEPIWSSGKSAKAFDAVAAGRPVGGIFSVGLEGSHRWKDSVQSAPEIVAWVAGSVANGMRPWWTKFAATTPDTRWLDPVRDLYRWLADCEPYLRNVRSLARVGVVHSTRQGGYDLGGQSAEDLETHLDGTYQALLEARVPFDLVNTDSIQPGSLARFDVVVLPNIAVLSAAQCAALSQFVEDGGGLVATHTTSLWDEEGSRRDDLGLGELFGARVTGDIEGPMRNSYLSLDRSGPSGLVCGLGGTTRIINGVHRLPVLPNGHDLFDVPLRLVASYPDLPMEELYVRDTEPGPPQAFLRSVGAGRVAYFPWDLDRTFWEVLHPDHGYLLAAAVRWAAQRRCPAEVTGPGLVEVTLWEQARSLALHLVNLTDPMAMRGTFRGPVALGPQRVAVEVPAGRTPSKVRLLRDGSEPSLAWDGVRASFQVPALLDYEIVAIDLD